MRPPRTTILLAVATVLLLATPAQAGTRQQPRGPYVETHVARHFVALGAARTSAGEDLFVVAEAWVADTPDGRVLRATAEVLADVECLTDGSDVVVRRRAPRTTVVATVTGTCFGRDGRTTPFTGDVDMTWVAGATTRHRIDRRNHGDCRLNLRERAATATGTIRFTGDALGGTADLRRIDDAGLVVARTRCRS